MAREAGRNTRLGLFVLIGTTILIFALYLIGSKRNLFGSTIRINAQFYNVNGLMAGNAVRFAGINVGTVEKVSIINDSTVHVEMIIQEKVQQFIKKNSVATVGTDGLMGDKLINISTVNDNSPVIEEGDLLRTLKPIETDDMIRTLNETNENIRMITEDLKNITGRFTSSNNIWRLLMDSAVAENLKQAIVNIKVTSTRTAVLTGDLSSIISNVKDGKGTLGALITDTTMSGNLRQTIVGIDVISDKLAIVSGDLEFLTKRIKQGEGTVGTLLMDTTFVHNLNKTMENVKSGSENLNENLEGLKQSILLRKYFQRKEKEKKKQPSVTVPVKK